MRSRPRTALAWVLAAAPILGRGAALERVTTDLGPNLGNVGSDLHLPTYQASWRPKVQIFHGAPAGRRQLR
ncbi:hypothetical protein GGS23DRAFT_544681 [Durotheca rogersii]|uniref:uncharacterized protein n=1 Tax=Durotheca rogersii TaxID=419775 RepID=UPI00221F4E13|nr:uncharacterized protein GGS23DRAFT_544681 [Durotheca rogersii]KAI5868257.1 hypothetical protein GGS23DRAFT_544681 [Durotheca rogersii]